MEIRILGPLEATDRDRAIRLGGRRQRLVLAGLVVRANRLVPVDELIDEVWGDDPPRAATSTLHSYVSRLRAAIGEERIEWRAPGYVLHAEVDEIDAHRFEQLIHGARALLTTEPDRASADFVEALALWQGPPLLELADRGALLAEARRLEELRGEAAEEWLGLELALGRDEHVVARAAELLNDHPLRERLWGLLMQGLYRSGRQAEALEAYHRLRRTLADELGIDPSPELQRLQLQILRQDPALQQRGLRLRGYRLLEPIGEGMFGVVHRAIQPHVEREVALKAIRPRLAHHPDFIRRFETEAQLVARLEHPRIVPLYDYWRDEYGAFLVMRWLRGGSLRDALASGPLPVPRTLAVVSQVGEALTAAHGAGIVHRDLKPANVLLDEEGNAYLSDFGIAKDLAAARADDAAADDSSGYLSPEEVRGEPTTLRSDVHGLGLVVYELLTGRMPWADGAHQTPVPVDRFRSDLGPEIDAVLARALASDADARQASIGDLVAELQAALDPSSVPARAAVPSRNPYKGLQAFSQSDVAEFFGRADLVRTMVERLAEPEPGGRMLAVVGPSGSGKSSAVRAGLLPALRAGALPGSGDWFVSEMVPGADPLGQLESALRRVAPTPIPGLASMLRQDPEGLSAALEALLPGDGPELVLLVDQLEELFTLAPSEERERFLHLVTASIRSRDSRLRLITTLRADFYDRPLAVPEFGALLGERTQVVPPLSAPELERVISGPMEGVGGRVEPALIPALVGASLERPGGLPLLEYTLTELFDRREGNELTLASLDEVGGVSGAIARRAESVYAELSAAEQTIVQRVLLRLVTVSEDGTVTRRRARRDEFTAVGGADAEVAARVESVLEAFGRHRLLTFDHDRVTRHPTVEIAHEALLEAWERLALWLDTARTQIRQHRRLGDQAEAWRQSARDPSFLARGAQLAALESLAREESLPLTVGEQEFLDASTAARAAEAAAEEEQRQRERALERRFIVRRRWLLGTLTTGVALAVGLAIFGFLQSQVVEREGRITTARRLAAAAIDNLETDPDLSINLAIEAVETTRRADGSVLREAQEALHRALLASRVIERLPQAEGAISSHDRRWYTLPTEGGLAIRDEWTQEELVILPIDVPDAFAVSNDGERVAAAAGGRIEIWDVGPASRAASFEVETNRIDDVAFSPDGERLAAKWTEAAVIWDLATEERYPIDLGNDQGFGIGLDWSPDGSVLAVAVGGDGAETLIVSGANGSTLRLLGDDGRTVLFSPDGSLLLTTGQGHAALWETTTWGKRFTLPHAGWVDGAAFNEDGTLAATGGDDGYARVWSTATGKEVAALPGNGGRVGLVVFSPSADLLAGWSTSGGLRWDLTPAGERVVRSWVNPHHFAFNVGVGPRGRLVTGGQDGAAMWTVEGELLVDFDVGGATVADIVIGPTGETVATAEFGGTVRLWTDEGDPVAALEGHTGEGWGVAFSPDGSRLASVATDGVGRVWDVATRSQVCVFPDHHDNVWDVAWSPNGTTLVSVGDDARGREWDPFACTAGPVLVGHSGGVIEQAFSPDGRQVATASFDGTAMVWDVASGERVWTLRTNAAVIDVEASPNGSRWATSSLDGQVRIWDSRTGLEVLSLEAQVDEGLRMAFIDDDHLVVGGDEAIRIYTLDVKELLSIGRERAIRSLTTSECLQYLAADRCS